jgi:hypothetical protein
MLTTTLSASCIDTDKTISVTSVAVFPPSLQFRVVIRKEELLVTAIVGTDLTVVRGYNGTEGDAYDAGEPVTLLITDELIKDIFASMSTMMLVADYDADSDGRVDVAEGINDGTYSATAQSLADAVTKKHTRSHSVTSTDDHSSSATSGKMLKADANGLPVDATNTDSDVSDAVTKKHSANTDTILTTNGTTALINAGSLKADMQLDENVGLVMDATLSADGKYSPVAIETGTLGATIAFGEVCYFKTADSKWYKAKGDAASTTSPKLAICVAGGNADDTKSMMLVGKIRADAQFPTFSVGMTVFLSTATAGAVTTTLPSKSTGHCIRALGQAITADAMWFCPSPDWAEYA